jgi:pyruvate dehydrogenase complex dehydrogenase (E1) component
MATEDEQMATQLLRTGATVPEQQQALSWLADYCEESYILNLPPASKVLQALDRFSRKTQADPALAGRAAKLYRQYKLR